MKKRILGIFISLLTVFILVSCGNNSTTDTNNKPETKESTKQVDTKTIKDMAGREVKVSSKIEKVYSSSPVGTTIMYTFDDNKMAGLNFDPSEEEKKFVTEKYLSLPNLGGWYGKGKTGNVEEIMKAKPDIVLSTGTDKKAIQEADKLQKQLNIPVVMIDDDFNKIPEMYTFLGKLLDNESRAKELADYCKETIDTAKEITDSIPEKDRVSVYYAEEAKGLNTDPKGSDHARLIDIAGGENVADVKSPSGYGRAEVSMEQVIAWNPDLIIAGVDSGYEGSGSYDLITSDSSWSKIKAVQDKNVYQTPNAPFNWFDRPPSVNTVIGVKWTQYILYPDKVKYDIKEEAKKFYKLFYHTDVSDKDIDDVLQKALRK